MVKISIVETDSIRGVKVPFEPPQALLEVINSVLADIPTYKGKSILFQLPKDHVETTWRNRYTQFLKDGKLTETFKLSIRKMEKEYDGFMLQLRVID